MLALSGHGRRELTTECRPLGPLGLLELHLRGALHFLPRRGLLTLTFLRAATFTVFCGAKFELVCECELHDLLLQLHDVLLDEPDTVLRTFKLDACTSERVHIEHQVLVGVWAVHVEHPSVWAVHVEHPSHGAMMEWRRGDPPWLGAPGSWTLKAATLSLSSLSLS